MESRTQLFGHPIHQMLIVFPLGLLATAVIFDFIYLVGESATMAGVAYWLIIAGVIGGLAAAPFGFIDWLAIPGGTRAKSIGLMHGLGNVVVLLLFIGSWMLRQGQATDPAVWAHVLSFLGASLALVTGWLGGELVDRLGVGISDEVNLDASTSLGHHHKAH